VSNEFHEQFFYQIKRRAGHVPDVFFVNYGAAPAFLNGSLYGRNHGLHSFSFLRMVST